MGDWIDSVVGAPHAAESIGGLDREAIVRLDGVLAALEEVAPGSGRRATMFALTGAHAEVVDELAMTQGGGGRLELLAAMKSPTAWIGGRDSPWAEWFKGRPGPAVVRRLGLIFAAATRSEPLVGSLAVAGLPMWASLVMWEAGTTRPNCYSSSDAVWLDHAVWERMLILDGMAADAVLKGALAAGTGYGPGRLLTLIPGMAGAVTRHPETVRGVLSGGDAKQRVAALAALSANACDPGPFAEVLAGLLVAEAKTVREAAETWAGNDVAGVVAAMFRHAETGNPAQRTLATLFIARRMTDGVAAFLAGRLAAEDNAGVRKVITDLQAQLVVTSAGPAQTAGLPPVPAVGIRPLGASGRAAVLRFAECWRARQLTEREEHRLNARSSAHPRHSVTFPPQPQGSAADSERLADLLERPDVTGDELTAWNGKLDAYHGLEEITAELHAVLGDPAATPELALRLAMATAAATPRENPHHFSFWLVSMVRDYRKASRRNTGTRALMAAADRLGVAAEDVAWWQLDSYFGLRWPLDDLWEWFYEHPAVIAGALGQGQSAAARGNYREKYIFANALSLVERFPDIPVSLQPLLWELAFGGNGAKRGAAQRALWRLPGLLPRVLAGLADTRQDSRLIAAEWLADLRDPASITALETAVKREKSEVVLAAMMTALENLGVPIDRFLDRPGLEKLAAKALAKGVPKELAWVPFDGLALPVWSDGGTLPRAVLTWWVVQAYKLKDPAPSPLLRRYAAMLDRTAAQETGARILEAWIAEDTRPPRPEQVAEYVRTKGAGVKANAQMMVQYSATYGSAVAGAQAAPALTVQQWYDRMIESWRTTPVGTLIGAKGALAVAAALGGPRLAPLVAQYLKRWYGMRAAQCKALLQMLAGTNHPTAIQVLLATATRFRTAGIRKEAEELVQEIAKRHGWSVDELADRTIPAAGFDEDGRMELSYGPRAFTVRLLADLDVAISDGNGKDLTALPAPRADDDAAAADAAKKTLAETKKQLKAIVKQQADRLYEAMCTDRRWPTADWRTYLLAHPVAGRLCRQVVWSWTATGPARGGTFRALEDGTLTDVDDAAVDLPDGARVAVAHPLAVAPEVAAAWKRHLADYEVAPLFGQFDRPPLSLPEANAQDQRIADRKGFLIEAFKLRGRATKLGWSRGQAEDGGWFHVYRKHFPAAGITAVLEFTGNSLPEENRITALTGLAFERGLPDGSSDGITLAEVPAPLLSECWNDFHDLAAQGTGFDPDWEKKASP
jgi:hypothetical protein